MHGFKVDDKVRLRRIRQTDLDNLLPLPAHNLPALDLPPLWLRPSADGFAFDPPAPELAFITSYTQASYDCSLATEFGFVSQFYLLSPALSLVVKPERSGQRRSRVRWSRNEVKKQPRSSQIANALRSCRWRKTTVTPVTPLFLSKNDFHSFTLPHRRPSVYQKTIITRGVLVGRALVAPGRLRRRHSRTVPVAADIQIDTMPPTAHHPCRTERCRPFVFCRPASCEYSLGYETRYAWDTCTTPDNRGRDNGEHGMLDNRRAA